MSDRATPNLPSRNFGDTSAFYAQLAFVETWRDEDWMILERGGITLEFFRHPELDPATSAFSCCLRLDDLDDFCARCLATGIPDRRHGWPRLHPPVLEDWGGTVAALIDPDGTLLRLIQNP